MFCTVLRALTGFQASTRAELHILSCLGSAQGLVDSQGKVRALCSQARPTWPNRQRYLETPSLPEMAQDGPNKPQKSPPDHPRITPRPPETVQERLRTVLYRTIPRQIRTAQSSPSRPRAAQKPPKSRTRGTQELSTSIPSLSLSIF